MEKIQKEELNKRLYFAFKFIILILLIIIQVVYPDFYHEYRIPKNLIESFLFLLTYLLVIGLSRMVLVYLYLKKHKKTNDFKDNFVLGVNQISSILSFFGIFISVLGLLNIEVKEFFTSISIIAAAIAILSKDYISNMINGMILMFSKQLALNENVKIGNHTGKIVDITLLNVQLLNDDNELIYVPNNYVFANDVVNYTKKNKKFSLEFELSPEQIRSFDEFNSYLQNNLKLYNKYIKNETIKLVVGKITKDFILFKYQFLFIKHSTEIEKEIKRLLGEKVLEYISEGNKISVTN